MKAEITTTALTQLWSYWYLKYGEGRNPDGLRFGQWIWTEYNLSEVFGSNTDDGFYDEETSVAYKKIHAEIHLNEMKSKLKR